MQARDERRRRRIDLDRRIHRPWVTSSSRNVEDGSVLTSDFLLQILERFV
jgi:hypothetical protein